MNTYIEIIEKKSGECVHRMDLTNRSAKRVEKIINRTKLNLDVETYSVIKEETDISLRTGVFKKYNQINN